MNNDFEWTDASSQDLKKLSFYGRPLMIPLDMSTPNENLVDFGSDWDSGMPTDIGETMLTFWCEQNEDIHVRWFPILCYRVLTNELPEFGAAAFNFSSHLLHNLSPLLQRLTDEYGQGYVRLLSRAAGVAAAKLRELEDGIDIATALDAVRIVGTR